MQHAHTQIGRPGIGQLAQPVVDAVRAIWTAHRRRRQRKRAIADLHALSDRSLADIGIERTEIEAVVRAGGRDPSRRHR